MNYDELLAPAAKAMRPSGIRKFFDLAADMPHCISLGVGEPDFKTPWSVRDAGIRSLELGRTKYTANAGLKDLRKEICTYLQRRFELHYQEENVLVTVGGSEAIDLAIRALVQPGDEVIIPEPCFVCYEPITQLTGGVPVHIATRAEDQFRLTADQLRALGTLSASDADTFGADPDSGAIAALSDAADTDRKTAAMVIQGVFGRAAKVLVANVAAMVLLTGGAQNRHRPMVVAVDGSLFRNSALLHPAVNEELDRFLVQKLQRYCVCKPISNASAVGAAAAALLQG